MIEESPRLRELATLAAHDELVAGFCDGVTRGARSIRASIASKGQSRG